jgi:hypothetical protein
VLAVLAWLSLASGDPVLFPPQGAVRVPVVVVDHGYHSGLVLRRIDVTAMAAALRGEHPDVARRLESLAAPWPAADWLEFGWGDEAFYQATRSVSEIQLRLAVPALLWPTPSVLQVVPGMGPPDAAFPGSDRVVLDLSAGGWRAMALRLAGSVGPGPGMEAEPVGPSLYGEGLFFRSSLSYHARRTCNQWVSELLRSAGVPSSWFWSMTSPGLLAELRLRAVR